jgi:hypothetical protein
MPRWTVYMMLHTYKIKILQTLKSSDCPQCYAFITDMLEQLEGANQFLKHVIFMDKAAFHILGQVNRYYIQIWGSENPHIVQKIKYDRPK